MVPAEIEIRRLLRLSLVGGAFVAAVAWSVLIPLKRSDLLPGHMTWPMVAIAPLAAALLVIGPVAVHEAPGDPGSAVFVTSRPA